MPLSDEAQQVVAMMKKVMPGGLHAIPIAEARAMGAKMAKAGPPGPDVARVEDRTIPGPAGDIPVRIYWPSAAANLPALVWFHGGAFALGSLDGSDYTCRELCNGARAVVISVDYRLAPEHKFPAGAEDCYAATAWAVRNSAQLGVDPARVAIGGDSAGGTLAAVVALMARDRGGPALVYQVLAYPTTLMRISSFEYADDPIVSFSMANHFWKAYVERDEDLLSPYCGPMNAKDLGGLPSAFIMVPEVDATRADQEAYGHRLAHSGVATTLKVYPGTPHGFFSMTLALTAAREAMVECSRYLRAAFDR